MQGVDEKMIGTPLAKQTDACLQDASDDMAMAYFSMWRVLWSTLFSTLVACTSILENDKASVEEGSLAILSRAARSAATMRQE
jgi:hypothetical protein